MGRGDGDPYTDCPVSTGCCRILRHKTLKNTVLLILANKTDYAGCMTLPEIVEGLDVRNVVGDRPWFVQRSCAISGQGLREGLDWLAQALEVQAAMERGMRRGNGLALFSSQRGAAAGQGGVAAAAAVAAAGAGGNGRFSGRFGLRRGVNGSTNSSLSSMGEGSEGEGGGEKEEREKAGDEGEEDADARFGRRRSSSGRRRLSVSGGSTAAARGEDEEEERRRSSRSGSWWQRLVGRDEEAEAARRRAAQADLEAFRSNHGDIDADPVPPGEGAAVGAAEGADQGLSNGSAHAAAAGTSGRLLQEPLSRGQGAGRPPLESEQEWEGGGDGGRP